MGKKELLSEEFLKQFKDSREFSSFIDEIYKRGIEAMLEGELDAHLGYLGYSGHIVPVIPGMLCHWKQV